MSRSSRNAVLAVATVIALLGFVETVHAQSKCEAGKMKCVIKKKSCLLGLESKALKAGAAPEPAKVTKCKAKFGGTCDAGANLGAVCTVDSECPGGSCAGGCFTKVEAKIPTPPDLPCPTSGDARRLETKVDNFVDDIITDLDPSYPAHPVNACAAGKVKCVIKKDKCILGVHAKAVKKGLSPETVKLAKCRAKFGGTCNAGPNLDQPCEIDSECPGGLCTGGCFTKLEQTKPPCLTNGDAQAVEVKVDAFDNDVVCLLDPASGTCPAVIINAGDDSWVSPASAGSFHDFSGNPIPAGFFDPSSDPFSGVLNLQGDPLPTNPASALGAVDTIIRRPASTAPLSIGMSGATIPIEIVALSLVSMNPITVTYNGGLSPEQWNVRVTLSSAQPQQQGTMTIRRTGPDGGTFDSTLPVLPTLTFTRQSDSAVRTLDCGFGGCGPITVLQSTGSAWSLVGGPGGYDRATNGIAATPPGVGVDGDGNGTFEYSTLGSSNFQGGVDAGTQTCVLTNQSSSLDQLGIIPECH